MADSEESPYNKHNIEFELRGPGKVFSPLHTVEASAWVIGEDRMVDEAITEIFTDFKRRIGMYDVTEGDLGTTDTCTVAEIRLRLEAAGYKVRP